ncbi:MAG: hypothetical protein QN178_07335 [Armatimonadota bacterium]|nr:hypothetical protein [Armatimonadota bacterium]
MSPGALVLAVAVVWLAVLVALFRVVAQMERVEREVAALDAQARPVPGARRG